MTWSKSQSTNERSKSVPIRSDSSFEIWSAEPGGISAQSALGGRLQRLKQEDTDLEFCGFRA